MPGTPEFMRSIARKGGLTTKARHGPEFFTEVGAMGGKASKGKIRQRRRKGETAILKTSVQVAEVTALTKTAIIASIDDLLAELERPA